MEIGQGVLGYVLVGKTGSGKWLFQREGGDLWGVVTNGPSCLKAPDYVPQDRLKHWLEHSIMCTDHGFIGCYFDSSSNAVTPLHVEVSKRYQAMIDNELSCGELLPYDPGFLIIDLNSRNFDNASTYVQLKPEARRNKLNALTTDDLEDQEAVQTAHTILIRAVAYRRYLKRRGGLPTEPEVKDVGPLAAEQLSDGNHAG